MQEPSLSGINTAPALPRIATPGGKLCQTCNGEGKLRLKTAKGLEYDARCPACNGRRYGYATK